MLEAKTTQLPEAWTTVGDQYHFHAEVDAAGHESGWISATAELDQRGSLNKRLAADAFLGKRIRLTGLCRSEDVVHNAGLYVRIEKPSGRYIGHDNMWDRPLVGTTDWRQCELVIDVPPDAGSIWMGAHIFGKGQICFKDLVIEAVSKDVPSTDQYALGCVGIWDTEPVNLDFTQDELPELREGRPNISQARRWIISSNDENANPYELVRSDVLFKGKRTALVRPVSQPGQGYLFQKFAAARFRNKHVRFSAYVKTQSAEAGAWLRVWVWDFDQNDLVWKHSANGVSGTSDWTRLDIEFDVPREAYVIDIGADFSGSGEMYLGGLEFEVLGEARTENFELLPGTSLYSPKDNGWVLERATVVHLIPGRPGPGIQLQSEKPPTQRGSSVGMRLTSFPVNRELTFSCLLRGSRFGQKIKVYVHAIDSKYKLLLESVSHIPIDQNNWASFETIFVVPPDAAHLNIWVVSSAAQAAYMTQPSLRAGEATNEPREYSKNYFTPIEPSATRIMEARYAVEAQALKEGCECKVTFPIPAPYRNQVPLSFTMQTKPQSALMGYEIKQRDDGINWIAEVRIMPPAKGVTISWQSLVLIRGKIDATLPDSSPEVPPHTAPWLLSSQLVQCEDDEITVKAAELASASGGLESYVRNVVHFTSTIRPKKRNKSNSPDAKTALEGGQSCAAQANLIAALLRANGIPARTVSVLPTSSRTFCFQHLAVEYWHPGVGWIWVEPEMNPRQPAANELVVLTVQSPDDEDESDNPVHLCYLTAPGTDKANSKPSKNTDAKPIIKRLGGPNVAFDQAEISGTEIDLDNLFRAALQNFQTVAAQRGCNNQSKERTEAILAAAYEGNPAELARCLHSAVSIVDSSAARKKSKPVRVSKKKMIKLHE